MKAALRTRYGPPDVVEVADVARPEPVGDEVLVRMQAASVNRADLDLIYPKPGFVRLFLGVRAPRAPGIGCDLAGVVEAVGPTARRFRPGDRVFGDMYPFGLGSFAEYKAVPERALLPIPSGLSFEVAATLPHAGILAVQGLRRRGGNTVRPGDRVLVVGASGNVGPFAVQVAKSLGAEVTGVCSTAKTEFVRSLGADHVIDYTKEDYTTSGARYDWIVDVESHHGIPAVRRALRPGGTYVTLGGGAWLILGALTLGPLMSLRSDRWSGLLLWWRPFAAEDMTTLTALVADEQVRPAIDRSFGLDEVAEALRYVDDGHARGKVIIRP